MRHLLVICAVAVLLAACEKTPRACFTVDAGIAEVHSAVTYTDCSENASFLQWHTGNGLPYSNEEIHVWYEEGGMYDVKLVAFSKNGYRQDSMIQQVPIYNRYVKSVTILDYPAMLNDSTPWDTDGPPDLQLLIHSSTLSSGSYTSPTLFNVAKSQLPVTISLEGIDAKMDDTVWHFTLRDADGVGGPEMADAIVSPIGAPDPLFVPLGNMEISWDLRLD